MSFKAALKIEGRNINLLYADFDFFQHINKDGYPGKYPQSGFITLIIESSADNFFIDWVLSATEMKSGSLFFYKRDNMSKMKELNFSDAYCVGFREKFSHTGEHPFFIEVKLSAGEMRYGESSYKNPWFVGGEREGEEEGKETDFVKPDTSQGEKAVADKKIPATESSSIALFNPQTDPPGDQKNLKSKDQVAPSSPLDDKKVKELIEKSPTLKEDLKNLKEAKWNLKYGTSGNGTFCDKKKKMIIIDPSEKGDANRIVQSLSHEVGHAFYNTGEPYYYPEMTKEQYVEGNLLRELWDEGEATLKNCEVREEILKNNGPDIGVAGAKNKEYIKIFKEYKGDPKKDRKKARNSIGELFKDHETPSGDQNAGKTYGDVYREPYIEAWETSRKEKK